MCVCFDHGVEDDEQFSHAGDDDDFGAFALSFKSVSECSNHRVVPTGSQSGHVQDASYCTATSKDRSGAAELPAVSIERRDSDQRGDLLSVEMPQLRKLGDQGGGGDLADSGRTLQQFGFAVPFIVRFHEPCDFGIDSADVLVEMVDVLLHAFADDL